jgi:hypothetical protein
MKPLFWCVPLAAAGMSAPAAAQYPMINDVIAQTISGMNQGTPERCLDGHWEPTEQQAARFTAEAEPALRTYLQLAASGGDLSPAFTNRRFDRKWSLDGQAATDFATVRDPWASRIARIELVGLRLGGMKVRGRGIWKAYGADGAELGTYDGLFRRKTKGFEVSSLDLYTPGTAKQPPALTGFCYTPGDTEEYFAAKAEREARKAAKRAAREAERAASAGK